MIYIHSFSTHCTFTISLGLINICFYVIGTAFPPILLLLFPWVLSIFAFMLLVFLIVCSCPVIIKGSVVLFNPNLGGPFRGSFQDGGTRVG